MLLAVALALLLAQGVSALLLYRAQAERREAMQISAAAFRLLRASRTGEIDPPPWGLSGARARGFRIERGTSSPLQRGETRDAAGEASLRQMLADQDVDVSEIVVIRRRVEHDPLASGRTAERSGRFGRHHGPLADRLLVAAIQVPEGEWLVARVFVPPGEPMLIASLIGQTLLIYTVLVGAIALMLRRITRPLATLTGRLERFAETRDAGGQLAPEGPDDIRRLIVAHNAMEGRIAALLDEKDVMLGAIGHDLKTPLAALRVRIENVEDERERSRMAATITDITQSLDDILSLARAGHAREAREMTELSALVASLVEEYEDMDEPVTLETSGRIVLPLRATWLRRAIRNLIDNALRYGRVARVSLERDGTSAAIRIDDDGPGIAEHDMARMFEPFTRGDPSRNIGTGGAGLGLALARAIAEQHGGTLVLTNRRAADGATAGLTAILRLPLG